MSSPQKRILALGALAAVLCLVLLPWAEFGQNGQVLRHGFHFIGSPPPSIHGGTVGIDWSRAWIPLVAVLLASAAGALLSPGKSERRTNH